MSEMEAKRVILVTGANKGIGYEIVRALLKDTNDIILLGARDKTRGQVSLARLQAEFADKKDNVSLEIIDIANKISRFELAKRLSNKFGKLDVVIHNAAVANYDPPGVEEKAGPTFALNYFGTFELNDALLPLLKKSARPRIIIMTSGAGQLAFSFCSEDKKKEVLGYQTLNAVDNAASQFVQVAEQNGEKAFDVLTAAGYGNPVIDVDLFAYSYCYSKMFLNTRVKVMKSLPEYQDVLLETVCPGHCSTDLSNNTGLRTAAKGAETPAWLTVENYEKLKNQEGENFWRDKKQISYFV